MTKFSRREVLRMIGIGAAALALGASGGSTSIEREVDTSEMVPTDDRVIEILGFDPRDYEYLAGIPFMGSYDVEPTEFGTTLIHFKQSHSSSDVIDPLYIEQVIAPSQRAIREMLLASGVEHVFAELVTPEVLDVFGKLKVVYREMGQISADDHNPVGRFTDTMKAMFEDMESQWLHRADPLLKLSTNEAARAYVVQKGLEGLLMRMEEAGSIDVWAMDSGYQALVHLREELLSEGSVDGRVNAATQLFFEDKIVLHAAETKEGYYDPAQPRVNESLIASTLKYNGDNLAKLERAELEREQMAQDAALQNSLFTFREEITLEKIEESGLVGKVDRIAILYGGMHDLKTEVLARYNSSVGLISVAPDRSQA